jgi:hypothetical protein
MLEFLRSQKEIENNPYKTASIKKLHMLPAFGLLDGGYGGRAKYIAELKDKDLLLIVDADLNTIDVARLKQDKQEVTYTQEEEVIKQPEIKRGRFGRPIPQ